jgi:hypothetical protein
MSDLQSPPRNWHSNDVVVTRLAVLTILYPFFNLGCLSLCTIGVVHPPWTMLSFLTWFPLMLAFIGFLPALSSKGRPARLWTCIGFVGLMFLASAFNHYLYYEGAAGV